MRHTRLERSSTIGLGGMCCIEGFQDGALHGVYALISNGAFCTKIYYTNN